METVLVLASQSPRRSEILSNAGILIKVQAPQVAEKRSPGELPEDYVRRLAREKALAVECGDGDLILGADTVVVVAGEVLEKPRDAADAIRMLRLLSNRNHSVITGICLHNASATILDVAETRVRFVPLSEREIHDYVATGEPMDKAGGYAIQGLASKFVDRIEGCYFNVVGLPIALVYRHLKESGYTA